MALVSGGSFRMGGADPDGFMVDGEGPVRDVHVSAFLMDRCTVSNSDFARFVDDTGYRD